MLALAFVAVIGPVVVAASLPPASEASLSSELLANAQSQHFVVEPFTGAATSSAGFRADAGTYAVTTGGSSAAADARGLVQWPLATRDANITDRFGPRVAPCGGCSSNHRGVDFGGALGAPVGAVAAGTVISVGEVDRGGLGVHVVLDHVIDGARVQSVYGHLVTGSVTVRVGDAVRVGDRLGALGNTGASTGPHLHLEIIRSGIHVDPLAYLYRYADGRDVTITDRPPVPWNPPQPGGEGEGWSPDQAVTPPPTPSEPPSSTAQTASVSTPAPTPTTERPTPTVVPTPHPDISPSSSGENGTSSSLP